MSPPCTTGESLLTVVVRNYSSVAADSGLAINVCEITGEPIIKCCSPALDVIDVIADKDPLQQEALFLAINKGMVHLLYYLVKKLGVEMNTLRHPDTGDLVIETLRTRDQYRRLADYLTVWGVFDATGDHASPLPIACRTVRVAQVVHFLRNTDWDPFETLDGKSLLLVLSQATYDFDATSAFVWCMCHRYAADPRWTNLIEDFMMTIARGTSQLCWAKSVRRESQEAPSASEEREALSCYAKLFYILQRFGVITPNAETSSLRRKLLDAARQVHNTMFIAAASTDFTVETYKLGIEKKATFSKAHEMVFAAPCNH